jgi:hypothetical protein
MKTKLMITALAALLVLNLDSHAQQASLVADQNPAYESSRAKYMNTADSLTSTQGTTVHNTYKAYDWYEAREERRKLRREQNYQNSWLYPSLNYYPAYNYNSWGYGGLGYRNWGHHNWRRHNNIWLGW